MCWTERGRARERRRTRKEPLSVRANRQTNDSSVTVFRRIDGRFIRKGRIWMSSRRREVRQSIIITHSGSTEIESECVVVGELSGGGRHI